MKFTCDKSEILPLLSIALKAIPRLPERVIFGCFHIQVDDTTLSVTSTGGDTWVVATHELECDDITPGEAVVPAKKFLDGLKELDAGAVNFEVSKKPSEIVLTQGTAKFKFYLRKAEDFPAVPSEDMDTIEVETVPFKNGVTRVLNSLSVEEGRTPLLGVYFTSEDAHLRMVSTDSYRLAIVDVPKIAAPNKLNGKLIPGKLLRLVHSQMAGTEKIDIGVSEHRVSFSTGNVLFISSFLDAEFPKYDALLPDESSMLQLDFSSEAKMSLRKSIQQAVVVLDGSEPLRLKLDSDSVSVKAISDAVGEVTVDIPISYDGEAMTIGLNPKYMSDIISDVPGEKFSLGINDSKKPLVLRGDPSDEFLGLLMPIRLAD